MASPPPTAATASPHEATALSAAQPATDELRELASLAETCVRSSTPILLGSRDPLGTSCLPSGRSGDTHDALPVRLADPDGGPGTRMMALVMVTKSPVKTAAEDFVWHQSRLKSYLENQAVLNEQPARLSHQFVEKTDQFYKTVAACTSWPEGLASIGYSNETDWPSYCVARLDRAAAQKDLKALQRWAAELAAAAFWLEDLHRWLGFLVENQLTALEFQSRCQQLFGMFDAHNPRYVPQQSLGRLPAGLLCINGHDNYYEIERQAERLLAMPPDRIATLARDEYLTPGSLWIPSRLRRCFVKIEEALSPANRRAWEEAARTPYERTFLLGMLYRTMATETTDEMRDMLRVFDVVHPRATVAELMSVLMYRGHSFGGVEWDDRYQPKLLKAGAAIGTAETDKKALLAAHTWTYNFYRSPERYGATFTLRQALTQEKLDCVRATDMIGAIFRDAGRTRFGHVRWCAETTAHSVAAYLGVDNGRPKTLLVDGLVPGGRLEVWPECYYHGHAWPAGIENNPSPYAVELYVRGLDNYVWAEGYIVRGPNAGWLTTAAIPYSVHRREKSTSKVFDGPYPEK
jgi:hypothetical protein